MSFLVFIFFFFQAFQPSCYLFDHQCLFQSCWPDTYSMSFQNSAHTLTIRIVFRLLVCPALNMKEHIPVSVPDLCYLIPLFIIWVSFYGTMSSLRIKARRTQDHLSHPSLVPGIWSSHFPDCKGIDDRTPWKSDLHHSQL